MAIRRDPRNEHETSPRRDDERVVEFPKEAVPSGIRPEMIEIGKQVIAERRRLLERLAAYDRGDDPGH